MADRLGLHFNETTKQGRADRLWRRLKTKKKMLVILDNVWKVVNLREIGIPFGDDHRGCIVLLTTRLRDICSYMECQPILFLRILSENEAWALFKINAVVRECQGLPIALVTVGRALRGKSTVELEVAFNELQNYEFQHMELIGDQNNTYVCLKLSYDYLTHEKTKLCFLQCCLFPEDYNIPIEDLMRYAVGYGLHQDVKSIEVARKQVYVIASSEEHGFIVKAGVGLKEWPMSNKSFEGCTQISLMGNKLAELPEGLVCPQLKVLLLELGDDLNVPERFFEGMKEIEVLSLKGGCLSLQSLELSTNLQSLLLIECKCNDIISLRKLQRLKILGFIWLPSLKELPDDIGELKELQLEKLEELLIGGYSFEGWGKKFGGDTASTNASLTELNLLSHLAVLSLSIPRVERLPKDFIFPKLLKYDIVLGKGYSKTEKPTSTRLYLSGISAPSLNAKTFEKLFPTVSQIRFIDVEGLENIFSGDQEDFLQRLEDVKVKGYRAICTLFPAKWRQALNNLISVEINDYESLEEVFELGKADERSSEVKELLVLGGLPKLKCIWKGPTKNVSLRSLVHLELQYLDKLTFIFTPHLAQSLVHLETLWIYYCNGLKHLIREKDDATEIIPEPLGFPKLKTLYIRACHQLEYVFPVSVSPSLLNLEEMEIAYLKQIFYSGEGIINFPQLRKLTLSSCSFFGPKNFTAQFPSLQVLYIKGHKELADLLAQLQISKTKGLTNLRVIRIFDCIGAHDKRTEHELSLLSLEKLDLSSMHDMRCIWKGLVLSHLTTLKVSYCQKLTHAAWLLICVKCQVEINECNKLTSLFPLAMVVDLPKHETLEVRNSSQLLGDDHASPVNVEKQMVLPNMVTMEINNCKSLEGVFELGEVDEGSSEAKELRLLSSLTRLVLGGLLELKCIWKGAPRHVSLQSLIHLELGSLHKLTFIFTPHLAQGLVHLERLRIDSCRGLKHIIKEKDDEREIIPNSLGFLKLKTLSISDCAKLEYVFPVSPNLQSLEEMNISYSCNLKQIFYGGEGDAHTSAVVINFHRLRELSLSSYSFFGPKNFTAQLPSLQVLYIKGHEELGDLLAQLQISKTKGHTNLREMRITSCKGAQDRRTGHELSLLSLEKLHLWSLPDMRCIWRGLVLSHLTTLKVFYSQKLTRVFTGSMVADLVQLQFLVISNYEELEHIIATDNHDEKDQILSGSHLQSLCFPNLCHVEIKGCNKLRTLFPVAMVSGSPKLQRLEVADSSQLLGVFGQDDHASPVNVEKQMVLPNLSFLKLDNLPSIVYFSLGCDDFLFPRRWQPTVDKCPKLTIKFANQTNGSTSAQSEVLLIRLDFMPLFYFAAISKYLRIQALVAPSQLKWIKDGVLDSIQLKASSCCSSLSNQ
ncbi:hypothetical protein SADUNF_Sadunf16G0288000 [Salix dunnii]|uniref:NB-ARC domain-containing protein n=1 Tax=Salix dunnii TaxID=1413687 RepID=A0A835JCP1_9ROSI|nr:hypothetical protein SADUNF_Sadunf16G0288000 [Salix dunnii]